MLAARHLLTIGDYRRTWAIGAVGGVARWLEFVALAIFTFELTGSPELVAMLGLLRMVPYMGCGVLMGALADALDRRLILMTNLIVMIALSATLAVVALNGSLTYAWIAASMLISGLYWTTDMPVRRRLLVDATEGSDIAGALGLDNACMYATRALGPIVGGATYQLVGVAGIFLLVSAMYALCLVLALRIEARRIKSVAAVKLSLWQRLVPPASLVANRRFLVILGVTAVFNMCCFPFVTMVPVIAQKEFQMLPAAVGAFTALEGLGGIVSALVVASFASERTLFRFYFWGVFAFLATLLAMTYNLAPLPTGLLLVLIGAASAAFSVTQYALVHVSVPAEIRGRAAGVLSMFIGTSIIGHYWTGVMFERDGTITAMTSMSTYGLAALVVLGLIWIAPGGQPKPDPVNPQP